MKRGRKKSETNSSSMISTFIGKNTVCAMNQKPQMYGNKYYVSSYTKKAGKGWKRLRRYTKNTKQQEVAQVLNEPDADRNLMSP